MKHLLNILSIVGLALLIIGAPLLSGKLMAVAAIMLTIWFCLYIYTYAPAYSAGVVI